MAKRLFDIIAVTCSLPLVMMLIVLLSLPAFIFMGFPVFFAQERIGRYGKKIKIMKFRTMTGEVSTGRGYREKERITPFGNFMRTFHLDELPQLLLVLKGTMSLVGPRPLLDIHLRGFENLEIRQSVRPGLTCYAQNRLYRDRFLDVNEQIALDIQYAREASLRVDLMIIAETIGLHVKRLINPGGN